MKKQLAKAASLLPLSFVVAVLALVLWRPAGATTDSWSNRLFNAFVQDSTSASGLSTNFVMLVGGSDGTNFHALKTDGFGNIGAAGNTTPADGFSNPTNAANGNALVSWFNGTTWDRSRDDGSKNLLTSLGTALDGLNDTVSIRINNIIPGIVAVDADAQSNTFNGVQILDYLHGLNNGGTWDRIGSSTKSVGTSPTNALAVQQFKDMGRSELTWSVNALAGATSDTLISTFTQNKDGTATGSVGSYTVTNGKTLRIKNITACVTFVTNDDVQTITFRRNNAGATTTSSGIWYVLTLASPSVTVTSTDANACTVVPFPDGYEIYGDGTKSFGVSQLQANSHTTNTVTLSISAQEY